MNDDVERVLSFWLEPKPKTEQETAERYRFWFYGGDTVDREIRERFTGLTARARNGELDTWAETARGALALIILIDQFSRNVYRGTADAFSCDGKALALAIALCESDRYAELDALDRVFVFLPFSHAEDLDVQRRGVRLAVLNAVRADRAWRPRLIESVDFARKHLDVVARFGRFPHRNAVLGRASTADEQEYLDYLQLAGQWL
jgi:uncharacterized protein (DUF924 family)